MARNNLTENEFYQPKIKIIGVGECGIRIINELVEKNIYDSEVYVVDTDLESLSSANIDKNHRIHIPKDKIKVDNFYVRFPAVGKIAAKESINKLKDIVKHTDILFVVNGLGKGTSGAVPVITKLAKEQGAINIVFGIMPAEYEGKLTNENADKLLQTLLEQESGVDSIVKAPNENFIDETSTIKSYRNISNAEISNCIKAFIDIFQTKDGLVTMDYEDIESFITNAKFMGIGISKIHTIDEKSLAFSEIANHPLLKDTLKSAKNAIINIQGGSDLNIGTVNGILAITNIFDDDASMMFSVQINNCLRPDEFQILLITT